MRRTLRIGAARRGREVRDLARTLGSFPAFGGRLQSDLEALAAAGRVISLPARWTFLHERTPADACYVLLDGEARVLSGGIQCGSLGPGSVLGEVGLLGRSLRTSSVVSSRALKVLRVEYDDLAVLLLAHPPLSTCLSAAYEEHRAADGRRRRDSVASLPA